MLAGHAGARALRELGVPFVAGVAGESYLPFLEGLRLEGIPFIPTAHESGAVFAALGYARQSGRPGYASVTRGPGMANATLGIYEAMQSRTPVVLVVGQVDTTLRHRGVIQEMEVVQAVAPITKAAIEVTRADRFAPALLAAHRTAMSGRPGPVVLAVPTDHLHGDVEPVPVPAALTGVPDAGRMPLGRDDLAGLVDAVASAGRPLVVLGRPFTHHRHVDLVRRASEVGLAILGGHSCPDVADPADPGWIGCSTVRAHAAIGEALDAADVVVALGDHLGDRSSQGYHPLRRAIGVSADELGVWDEYLDLERLTADPVTALDQLVTALEDDGRRGAAPWVADVRAVLRHSRQAVFTRDADRDRGFVPMSAVVTAVDRAMPPSAMLASDVGTFNDWFTRYLPFPPGRRYLGPTANPMGCALPSAIGAHDPSGVDRTVVVVGDGGFMMSATELSTLARSGLDITVMVFANGVWGSIARDQDRTYGTRFGTDIGPPADMVALAGSFGLTGRRPTGPDDLDEVLAAAFATPGPNLVEVRTDPARLSPADLEG